MDDEKIYNFPYSLYSPNELLCNGNVLIMNKKILKQSKYILFIKS